jgi:hypothetical protein
MGGVISLTDQEQREFKDTVRKVDRLHDLLYANGFAQSVKDLTGDMKELKDEMHELAKSFAVFTAGRAATCPFRYDTREEKRQRRLLAAVIFAGSSSTIALITLALRIGGAI